MKRLLFALAVTNGLASAADAVSVELVADRASYLTGDTVTISVVVDAAGEADIEVGGRFVYDPAILLGGSVSEVPLTSGNGAHVWQTFDPLCPESPGECLAFFQLSNAELPIPVDQPAGFVISTLTFTAGAPGTTPLEWSQLDFFGLGASGAVGTTVHVTPEPGSGALIASGLLGLVAARRRRS